MRFDKRLLAQLRTTRVLFALTILSGFGVGVLILAQARGLSAIIAQVFLRGATLGGVRDVLLLLLAIVVGRAALAWASEVSAFEIAARIKRDLRERVLAHLLALGPAYVRGERTGELTNTLGEGIEALEAYFSQYLPQLVLAALVPLTLLAFVFPLDLLSGVVLLLTAPLIPLFMILIGSAADALTRRQWKALSLLSAHFLDVLQGLTTLKLFGRSREQSETIARVSQQFRDTTLGVLRVAFLSAFALEMIATISTAIVAVEIGLRLLYGQLEFEQAFFVLVLAPDFYLPLRLLGTRFHAGMTGVAAGARVFEILEQRQKAEGGRRNDSSSFILHPSSFLGFNDVHYSYAGARAALNGVSFSIERGEVVALVGPTGAGKSTLANLLLRFIAPARGEIRCAGKSLNDWTPRAWRAQVAWVPQMPYLFNDTVANNIRLARPDATLDEVIHAARLARADEFISALPQGYATPIGERGARLSGGQAQRLALARAFLKDAPLLLLDEPTSQLDPENEMRIQDALARLLENKTALIISHRLATLARANKIIVLEQGRVAELGAPAELLARRGAYDRLVTAGQTTEDGGRKTKDDSAQIQISNFQLPTSNFQLPISNFQLPIPQSSIENRVTYHVSRLPPPASRPTFLRLLQFVAPYKRLIALAVVLGACTIGSGIGLMATAAYIIASAARHPSIADLAVPIVGVRFFGIARGVFRYLERCVSHYVNFNLLARLRVWFYESIEPRAPARLMPYRSGDLLTRIVGDIETLQNFYVRVLAPPLVALAIAMVMGVFLAHFDVMLALTVLAFMFLVGVILPTLARQTSQLLNDQTIQLRSELNAHLVDALQGIADLLAYGREQAQKQLIADLNRAYGRAQARLASIASGYNAAGNLLTHLAMWCVLFLAIPMVNAARLDGVYLPVLALAVLASFEGVLALPPAFHYLEGSLQAARRLFEIADDRPQTTDHRPQTNAAVGGGAGAQENGNATTRPRRSAVVFDKVSFRYAPDEPRALDRVSFELRAGSRLAILGPSGAGKSSIVNLLLRFWDYEEGHIVVGGRELREYAPEDARAWFAVVPQTTHLFNATIRENLLLARPDATQGEMIAAAQQAQIHDFIAALPDGYATRIGEQGLRLSGGERQRLALARALLKDAPILILDEATAHLDPLTERAVWRALNALAPPPTLLVITHQHVRLEEVDDMITLEAGRVRTEGRRDDR
jgi:ATP-binding cassette subfamily C protein CydCD